MFGQGNQKTNDNINGIQFEYAKNGKDLPPLKKPGSRGSSQHSTYGNSLNSQIENYTSNFKILANENRINELESKLLVMEQNQIQLVNQIKNFELKQEISKNDQLIMSNADTHKQERLEKLLSIIKDQTFSDKAELSNKIDLIEEILSREEKIKQDQRERDIELYKSMINNLTERVSETVKLEVEERFKADLENKIITQNITHKFLEELDKIKYKSDETLLQLSNIQVECSKDCSIRTQALSKYLENQLIDNNNNGNKQSEQVKMYLSKLTEEVKNNIKNQDIINEGLENHFKILVKDVKSKQVEVDNKLKNVEDRLIAKIDDFKDYIDSLVLSKEKNIHFKIDEEAKKNNENVDSVKKEIKSQVEKIEQNINDFKQKQIRFNESITKDIEEEILPRLSAYEDLLKVFEIEKNKNNKILLEEISNIQSKIEIKEVNDRILRNLEFNEVVSMINRMREDIMDFGTNVQFDMGDIVKDYNAQFKMLGDANKMIFQKIANMESNTRNMFEEIYIEMDTNNQQTMDNIDKVIISNIMDEMLTKIESLEIHQELIDQQNFDEYLDERCEGFKIAILRIGEIRKDDLIRYDVDMIMIRMMEEFDKIDIYNSMEREFKQNYEMISNFEANVEQKFKDVDDAAFKSDTEFNRKITNIYDVLRTKKDLEDEEELKKIEAEIAQKKREEEYKDALLSENQKFREMLEVKTVTDNMLINLEIGNIYQNFLQVDKKFLRYDEVNQDYKVKIQSLETRSTKLESGLINLNNYVDQEILAKVITEEIATRATFEVINDRVEYAVTLRENEERDMVIITKMINDKAIETNEKVESISKEYEEKNDKRHRDALDNMDSKIIKSLEKIKQDNIDMWTHSIVMQNKISSTEEVRKIIQSIPPVITSTEESLKKIWELQHPSTNSSKISEYKPNFLKSKGNVDKIIEQANNKGEQYKDDKWKNNVDKSNKDNKENKDNKDNKNPKNSGSSNFTNMFHIDRETYDNREKGMEVKSIPKK